MEKKYIKPETKIAVPYILCEVTRESGVLRTTKFMTKERNSFEENQEIDESKYGDVQSTIW